MYYRDLDSAEEGHYSVSGKDAVYIGWLDPSEEEIVTGESSEEFREKARRLCDSQKFEQARHRGFHICPFCDQATSSTTLLIPNESKDKTYFFPGMLAHYVDAHNYCPPQEFIDAVMALDLTPRKKPKAIKRLRGLSRDLRKK